MVREFAGRRWGDDWRRAVVDGVDDLSVVDPLVINAGDAEVGVPELALDDDQRTPSGAISTAWAWRS
jgi:hypothetical protein